MKILILNAADDPYDLLQSFVVSLEEKIKGEGHSTEQINLINKNIHFCTGCWSCWWKTPGKCSFTDDMEEIYKAYIKSDLVLFVTPLKKGHESSLMKKVKDRLIVLLHPYIELVDGECHHKNRYAHYPKISYLVQKEPDTDGEDIVIMEELQKRFALNFKTRIQGFYTTEHSPKDICYELIAD